MKARLKNQLCLTVGALWLATSLPLAADVIYDNTVNDLHLRFNPGHNEVGDEIVLSGTQRYLTSFSFEYWGTNTLSPGNISFSGAVQARVIFYENNGPLFPGGPGSYASPGTVFYDSGYFPIIPTPRSTVTFTASDFASGLVPLIGAMPVVSNMTWSVQFTGLNSSDSVGVDLYSPPVVGGNYADYWQNTGFGGWTLMTNSAGPIDFGAQMQAAPEPSSLLLGLVGGVGILFGVGRFGRKK